MVEVPPRELPYERLGARTARPAGPVDQLDGGEGAEMQMGREPGGGVAGQVVVPVLVRVDTGRAARR